jgi:hypothetical protein
MPLVDLSTNNRFCFRFKHTIRTDLIHDYPDTCVSIWMYSVSRKHLFNSNGNRLLVGSNV